MTDPTRSTLEVLLPPGIPSAAVVQVALIIRQPDGSLAGVTGDNRQGVPIPRRDVADMLDALAEELYRQAAELDGEPA